MNSTNDALALLAYDADTNDYVGALTDDQAAAYLAEIEDGPTEGKVDGAAYSFPGRTIYAE